MKQLTEIEYNELLKSKVSDGQKKQFTDLLSTVREYIPEAENIYFVDEYDNLWEMRIEFQRNGITYQVTHFTGGKYYIQAKIDHFKQVDNYERGRIQDHYPRPNYIGIFTAKKVEDWINYATSVYKDLEILEDAAQKTEDAFLKSLEGENIRWIKDGKSGEIRKNGILFQFTISPGYISQTISLDYTVTHNFDTFKKLSDNQFK